MNNPFFRLPAIVITLLMGVSTAVQANDAVALLNKMSTALETLDYHGKLVFSHNRGFDTLAIIHRVDNGVEREQVLKLNDANTSNIVRREISDFSFSDFPKINGEMLQGYSFDLGGKSVIAGRECYRVVARPRDKMRYLHHYCIEPESGLLLSYSLVNRQREVVEKMMFTDVTFGKKDIDDVKSKRVAKKPFNLKKTNNDIKWVFSDLPAGFYINKTLKSEMSFKSSVQADSETLIKEVSDQFTQVIITDRVASISVFIEPQINRMGENEPTLNQSSLNKKISSKGAINSLTVSKSGHMLTAVGDVPAATLHTILDGMNYVSQ
jgi:sigma-E factor negative regulatory protein RseB